ncbi:UTP--glucose-1-phosphate uridylyltransferase subunit GalU [Edwardsiella ictaluri]|uniref:UTP--glucose-1-phosphate uridylyltransferase n=2 Tax=Edwardsiella ictaluri TaxID=67780 RepID=C5BCQ2_EDWI9|nr:sugar phosphate nucleotidyltransferase [Edwardsiella ictaluri]AAL25634.1 UTP-glucose-1-phosphate uridylyltransferase [Edwardsiella ictaluri 93-146]ACR68507.1 nucleotidyl transferase family protein [Edwardsiella ictaluri 93-146]ARD40815.1 UTP--glucose-1-phosphate uridylyltransferase subunit GalU [Edwardsiella ictaluri]AVZ81170.1 UTP--glucose-1-phosphate uridylyltransferase subunit GalU [Edwardsiella ictaluri]EKS7763783.1 UTP--glucose-1-phosphate uridylyltransferase subunit GalU [Edwardsiella
MTSLKAVIPVAGLGMKMLPATKAIPKEMLPIVDKPLIQKVVHECLSAGVKEIILVTHSSKNTIENHFDTSFELEALLEARVKRQLLDEVRSICPPGVTINSVRQHRQLGLGHAILCARPLVGEHPFIVALPDIWLDASTFDPETQNLAAMVRRFEESGRSQVLVQPMPLEALPEYSVINCADAVLEPGQSACMTSIVEKPEDAEKYHSDLSAVGRYVLSAAIWPILAATGFGAWERIQLSDAIATLLQHRPVEAYRQVGLSYDCGDKLGYAEAFVAGGLNHSQQGAAFTAWLQDVQTRIE